MPKHRTGYDAGVKSRDLKTTYLSAAAGLGVFVTAALVLGYYLDHRAAPPADFHLWLGILFATGLVMTSMTVGISWLLARRMERPISALIRTAERIGEGD